MASIAAPPYIPLIRFYRQHLHHPLPVLPVYWWKQENLATTLNHFTEKYFPEYKSIAPAQYINQLIEKIEPAADLLEDS